MTNLKPCPFCGVEPEVEELFADYHVLCMNCHCRGRMERIKALATQAWNSQTFDKDLLEALAWYEEHVGNCRKITPEGERSRNLLSFDGGKRAREAIKQARDAE